MTQATIKASLKVDGVKYEGEKEVNLCDTLEELANEFSDEEIVKKFNAEFRRNIQSDIRADIEAEHGTKLTAKAKALMTTLELLGVDYGDARTEAELLGYLQ